MKEDKVRRSYVALQALKNNAPEWVDDTYLAQYHEELDRLEGEGYNVEEWRIPAHWPRRRLISRNRLSGAEIWTDTAQIKQHELFAKLDAVLSYFLIADFPIGFEGPRRK
jgi:hypothetical protein